MQRQIFKPLILCSMLAGTSLLSGCGDAEATNNTDKQAEVIAIPVEVAPLSRGDISSNYATTAILEAKEEAFVVARASGIIHEIMVEEGDYVEKNQVLARLETERYELNLKRAEANLLGIEKELKKVRDMYQRKLASDDAFDKLTAAYDGAKAELELARLDLSETTIRAPIAGFIAERNAKVGNLTESFQRERMFHIVQQKQLYGVVHLPEKELPRVHVQQQAKLNVTALGDNGVNAYVERISPVIDANTGTFKVTLRVPNEDNHLKAGMFAQVRLNYDTHQNATLLPRQAVLNIDDKVNVFVVKDGVAEKIQIKTGYQEGNMVEVLSGLTGDEQVVITGHHNLKDKAPVEIVNG
ncbi:efflux RND transporter periplasmic adaptor subunit [Aliiglaciecola sp. CAU 1673]|uniref:efflux RND transporter periplasmic adaptor subunit n=1 Tax=Aliiglaciecola sp. CAU 1673 TaxID=3032595 RepID=UPI0023DB2834|nr:efflux RND transporter periplasmic adaptor subunit [Aliiglaciecola sp. CAU 1673]MDF2178175.1 efflux RND transporter periplasmic adaptor subunit [Aliiglaciecola sp. CAU 1673]